MNDCGWNRCRVVDSYQGVGKGTGGVSYLIVVFFYLCFCLLFSYVLSLFLNEQSMIVVVPVSLFILLFAFLCLWSF